jgi:hypothetical protein
VTGSHTSDRERKAQRDVHGVAISSEADFATHETLETTQGLIVARLPSPPNAKGSLASIYVATPIATVTVAAMDAVSTDKPIQAGLDCFGRAHRTD